MSQLISRRRALQGGGLLAASLALAACGGGKGAGLAPSTQAVGSIDINPQPRDNVRDGGDLRLPLTGLPNNYNYNQVDGTTTVVSDLSGAILPTWFIGTADGGVRVNPDYATSVELTSTSPQVVTYTINPKATWSDGGPISWLDFAAYWKASNGSNPAFQTSGTTGYSDISSVVRGVDDRQAVVTFGKAFAEWQGLFNPFFPASLNATPEAFNTAWRTTIPVTAGPFTLDSIDQGAQTVTLRRDPKWWGTPAKLDRVIYKVVDISALSDAIANNEIDCFELGSSADLLRRAQNTPGVQVRNAPSRIYNNITVNGAPGAILNDRALRRAALQGIDRAAVTRRLIGATVPDAQPDGNHIYVPGVKQYRDNADVLPFDAAAANRALDQLGWVRNGATRQKNGTPLTLRMVLLNAPTNTDVAKTVQNQLAQIGVTVTLQQLPGNQIVPAQTTGNFDLVVGGWGTTTTPLSSTVGIFATVVGNNIQQNYGRIANPQIDTLFTQAIAELDDEKRAELGNQIDRLIWDEGHSIPLYARPGAVAVRATLANFGAHGFADIDYINAGYVK
ncbi:MAG TPA: ABC transporter family substrate-binding protein [Pseudonocardia sp.]|jgi:peptide/nickel transport system substrate-binding protein|nr:ABC transporter family substrate-binding protein [Pseudonocardia sp.]